MTINPKGLIALCSEDLRFDEVMGDVSKDNLLSIFHSDSYKKVRQELLNGHRHIKSTCAQCDYTGMTRELITELGHPSFFQ